MHQDAWDQAYSPVIHFPYMETRLPYLSYLELFAFKLQQLFPHLFESVLEISKLSSHHSKFPYLGNTPQSCPTAICIKFYSFVFLFKDLECYFYSYKSLYNAHLSFVQFTFQSSKKYTSLLLFKECLCLKFVF